MLLAKRIWRGNVGDKDVYVDFKRKFDVNEKEKKIRIDVSAGGKTYTANFDKDEKGRK